MDNNAQMQFGLGGSDKSDDIVCRQMTDNALKNTKRDNPACFVAGTLVHTDKGLVSIEQIKIGDMVLSKPESGMGETCYKPVTRKFAFEDKEVWFVEVSNLFCMGSNEMLAGSISGVTDYLVSTPDHPFRLVGELDVSNGIDIENPIVRFYDEGCWSRLCNIGYHAILQLANGSYVSITSIQPVFRMNNPDHGFIPGYRTSMHWSASEFGSFVDFSSGVNFHKKQRRSFSNDYEGDDDPAIMCRKVYNIEVADFHTYFVGRSGIWVHNEKYE